ncbi:MAG: YHYH protein [Pyrinomonadaceae bacterium]|nr:YHYH protein [Pyrinomonadaceae bacterium]
MKNIFYLLLVTLLVLGGFAFVSKWQVNANPETNQVEITEKDGYRLIKSNGIPNHDTGRFPNAHNPNTISAQKYNFRVPLEPKKNERSTFAPLFGVALNGIPFDPGTAELWNNDFNWRYEALTGGIDLGVDSSNAHVQPTGAYHYHGIPVGLVKKLGGEGKVVLIGYASDGFPIYSQFGYTNPNDANSAVKELKGSYRIKEGNRPENAPNGKYNGTFVHDWEYVAGLGDLDECNGRFGVTPEYPKGVYHYYLTKSYPFIPRCTMGTPDQSFRKMGPPPGGRGPGGGRPPGGGPPPFGRPPGEE